MFDLHTHNSIHTYIPYIKIAFYLLHRKSFYIVFLYYIEYFTKRRKDSFVTWWNIAYGVFQSLMFQFCWKNKYILFIFRWKKKVFFFSIENILKISYLLSRNLKEIYFSSGNALWLFFLEELMQKTINVFIMLLLSLQNFNTSKLFYYREYSLFILFWDFLLYLK